MSPLRMINRIALWGWIALVPSAVVVGEGVAYALATLQQTPPTPEVRTVPMEAIVLVVTFMAGVLVTVGVSIEQLRRLRVDFVGMSKALHEHKQEVDGRLDAHRDRLTDTELDVAVVKERIGMKHFDARLHREGRAGGDNTR